MCGIIAVLRGPDNRPIEQRDTVLPPRTAVDDLSHAESLDSASTQLRVLVLSSNSKRLSFRSTGPRAARL